MKKQILCFLLALALTLSFAGCGAPSDSEQPVPSESMSAPADASGSTETEDSSSEESAATYRVVYAPDVPAEEIDEKLTPVFEMESGSVLYRPYQIVPVDGGEPVFTVGFPIDAEFSDDETVCTTEDTVNMIFSSPHYLVAEITPGFGGGTAFSYDIMLNLLQELPEGRYEPVSEELLMRTNYTYAIDTPTCLELYSMDGALYEVISEDVMMGLMTSASPEKIFFAYTLDDEVGSGQDPVTFEICCYDLNRSETTLLGEVQCLYIESISQDSFTYRSDFDSDPVACLYSDLENTAA